MSFHEKAGLCQDILWLSKFIFVFLGPDRGRFLAGSGPRKTNILLSRPVYSFEVSVSCRHPSIRTLCERLMRSVHIGCPRYSRRCRLKAPSRAIGRWSGGKAKGAVAGTRHLVRMYPRYLSELCCQLSPLSRVVERFIFSQLIQR